MKRFINWFISWTKKMCWEEKAGFALGGTAGIVVFILIFLSIDKYLFWLWAFFLSLAIGIWVYCAGAFLFTILIGAFCILVNIPVREDSIFVKYNK